MSELASIRQLWEKRGPFPHALAGKDIAGQCLVMFDDSAAGCITGVLRGNRAPHLDAHRLRILSEYAAFLARVCPQLPEEHRIYFDTVREVSERVVRYCKRGRVRAA
jgi:hypothetical protein